MTIHRPYEREIDYEKIEHFLVRTYDPAGDHVNWVQPRWEYMHYHPLIHDVDLSRAGVWEEDGRIVAVVHPEHGMGIAYFEIDPGHHDVKAEMVRHAEEYLTDDDDGVRRLRVYVNDRDQDFQTLVSKAGYVRTGRSEPMAHMTIPDPFPPISLPDGFRLKSLADDNDLQKVDRVLWRGFGHGDQPPAGGIADRRFMQSAPSYRKDLNVVVEAPNGRFVAYCGTWYEPVHALAYVEPVATDPDYRRLGLGSAAVLEGIRRCGALGARVACVGSALPFYLSLGFRVVYNRSAWQRQWTL